MNPDYTVQRVIRQLSTDCSAVGVEMFPATQSTIEIYNKVDGKYITTIDYLTAHIFMHAYSIGHAECKRCHV